MAEHPPVERPLLTRPKHAGVTKIDFSRNGAFGFAGQMFLGEFGAGVPITGSEPTQVGDQVVRIDLGTGQAEPFFIARPEALGRAGTLRPRGRSTRWE